MTYEIKSLAQEKRSSKLAKFEQQNVITDHQQRTLIISALINSLVFTVHHENATFTRPFDHCRRNQFDVGSKLIINVAPTNLKLRKKKKIKPLKKIPQIFCRL